MRCEGLQSEQEVTRWFDLIEFDIANKQKWKEELFSEADENIWNCDGEKITRESNFNVKSTNLCLCVRFLICFLFCYCFAYIYIYSSFSFFTTIHPLLSLFLLFFFCLYSDFGWWTIHSFIHSFKDMFIPFFILNSNNTEFN